MQPNLLGCTPAASVTLDSSCVVFAIIYYKCPYTGRGKGEERRKKEGKGIGRGEKICTGIICIVPSISCMCHPAKSQSTEKESSEQIASLNSFYELTPCRNVSVSILLFY